MASAVRSTALRAGGACVRCRKGKTKCVYENGRAPCKNCAKGLHECYLPSESMSHGGHGVSPARLQQRSRESLPSERTVSGTAGERQGPPASSVSRHVSSTTEKYVSFFSILFCPFLFLGGFSFRVINLCLFRTGCAYLRTACCFCTFSREICTFPGGSGGCALPLATALPVPGFAPPPAEFAYSSAAPRSSSQAPFSPPGLHSPNCPRIFPSAPCAPLPSQSRVSWHWPPSARGRRNSSSAMLRAHAADVAPQPMSRPRRSPGRRPAPSFSS